MERDALIAEILGWLDALGLGTPLEAHSELVSSGLVDSGDLVRLATWLETRFGVSIPDDDIDADHFDSAAMIADYVRERLPA